MTAHHRRSRGLAHSRKIKYSPGWERYSRERQTPLARRAALYRHEPDMTQGWLLLAEAAWGMAIPRLISHLLRPSRYSDEAIRQQLRDWYLAGYVRALLDVKRERERMEDASYIASMPTITAQEFATINSAFGHRYGARRAA